MSADERKTVSKAKKAEKYSSTPSSSASASSATAVAVEEKKGAVPTAVSGPGDNGSKVTSADGNMESLRQRLQVRM